MLDTLTKDEQGNYSMGRILLALWTAFIMVMLTWHHGELNQPVLTFFGSVYMFLVTWVSGPRIAQYLAPQIASAVSAIGQAKSVEISTDVKEITEKFKTKKP